MTATTLHYLHYTATTTPLRYNYNYSCSTSHYIQQLWVRWPLQPLQPLQQTQLQPPFGQSVASLCHPWFTTTNVSYRFPIFETSATALCGTTGIKTFLIPKVSVLKWFGDWNRQHLYKFQRKTHPQALRFHTYRSTKKIQYSTDQT